MVKIYENRTRNDFDRIFGKKRALYIIYRKKDICHLFINTKTCIWHNTVSNVSFHTIRMTYFLLMQLTHEYNTFRKELQKFIFNCFNVLILYRLSIRSLIVAITHFLPLFLSFLLQKKRSIFLNVVFVIFNKVL